MRIPCSWVNNLWLVNLLLLVTHAHPLFVGKQFVVSESIIANHSCHPLFVGKQFVVSESIIANHSCASLVRG